MVITGTLRILQTSDVHMHVLHYDYFRNMPDPMRGLVRAGSVIDAARREGTTLLLDTGDLLQGTPMATLFAQSAPATHPACEAITALGYDAVTLGNHDFNFGLKAAARLYRGLQCPVVQSNVRDTDGAPLFAPTALLERTVVDANGAEHPLRIGVFGVLPPQILDWDREKLHGRVTVEDMVQAAVRASGDLRAQGADLIIALAHTAPASGPQPTGAENRAHEIAALPDVDIILAGHSHKSLPSEDYAGMPGVDPVAATLAGTPAMMPGANASHIARMDLELEKDGPRWRVAAHKARLIALADHAPCPSLTTKLTPQHARTQRFVTRTIATTEAPVSGTGFAFGFDTGQVLMAEAKRWRVGTQLDDDTPLIVATAPYRIATAPEGLCLPPGPISRCDLFTLYPYPNAMCVLRVTGALLKSWLEHAAHFFAAQHHDVVGPLIDATVPSYNFDTLHGLSYRIDPFAPTGDRIRDLRHDGNPLSPHTPFLLATSTYRAHGGGGFPPAEMIWSDSIPITLMMEQYLAAHGRVRPQHQLGWQLAPQDGQSTVVTLGDAPRAQVTGLGADMLQMLAQRFGAPYMESREVGAGEHLANPVRSGRKQP